MVPSAVLGTKHLNRAIKRLHHCTPTLDDVLPKMNGIGNKKTSALLMPVVNNGTLNSIMPFPCTQPSTHPRADVDTYGIPPV